MKEIRKEIECPDCDGSGLYAGMCERDGAAVVCHNCNGTGKYIFVLKYKDFKGRKKRQGIQRVYKTNVGICIGNSEKHKCKLKDFGGMPYKDWYKGKKFPKGSEMRKYTCPACWFQSTDYRKKPKWCYDDYDFCSGSFSECKQFKNKSECWKRIDKESK